MGKERKTANDGNDNASRKRTEMRLVPGNKKRVPRRYFWCGTGRLGRASMKVSRQSDDIVTVRETIDMKEAA